MAVNAETMNDLNFFLHSDYPENEEIKTLLQEQLNALSK